MNINYTFNFQLLLNFVIFLCSIMILLLKSATHFSFTCINWLKFDFDWYNYTFSRVTHSELDFHRGVGKIVPLKTFSLKWRTTRRDKRGDSFASVARCLRKRKDVTAWSRRKLQATFQAWHTCRRWSPSSTTRKYSRDTSATRSDNFSDAQSGSLAFAKFIIAFVSTK